MGMDIYCQAPTAPEGEYFRRNVWGWVPLAGLVTTLCPDEASPCHGWQYNGGDGLDAADAVRLAVKLQALRDSGDVAAYCAQRDEWAATLPHIECRFCGGTRLDGDAPATPPKNIADAAMTIVAHAQAQAGWRSDDVPCPVCDGVGTIEPAEKACRLVPNDVDQFIAFLKASGGFEIW
jgi:hypothetical protein